MIFQINMCTHFVCGMHTVFAVIIVVIVAHQQRPPPPPRWMCAGGKECESNQNNENAKKQNANAKLYCIRMVSGYEQNKCNTKYTQIWTHSTHTLFHYVKWTGVVEQCAHRHIQSYCGCVAANIWPNRETWIERPNRGREWRKHLFLKKYDDERVLHTLLLMMVAVLVVVLVHNEKPTINKPKRNFHTQWTFQFYIRKSTTFTAFAVLLDFGSHIWTAINELLLFDAVVRCDVDAGTMVQYIYFESLSLELRATVDNIYSKSIICPLFCCQQSAHVVNALLSIL